MFVMLCILFAEMHLANARQTKHDDATDDDMPSTSGRKFAEATFSDSSSSKVFKVEYIVGDFQCL